MVKFLEVELALGLTFAAIALSTLDPRKRARNRTNAHKAFNAVVNLRTHAELVPEKAAEITAGLNRLRVALERIDEVQHQGSRTL